MNKIIRLILSILGALLLWPLVAFAIINTLWFILTIGLFAVLAIFLYKRLK